MGEENEEAEREEEEKRKVGDAQNEPKKWTGKETENDKEATNKRDKR